MTSAEPGYRQSAGTDRGNQRKATLLAAVTDDLAEHGLVDFSLRRAARAAGSTHKVLLYHFHSVDELLGDAMTELRRRRVANALAVGTAGTLGERVAAFWPVMQDDASGLRVIDQAIGLAMYDPVRYAHLARDANAAYLDALRELCPPAWDEDRRTEVATLILAAMRGFLIEWRVSADADWIARGLAALQRALDNEERLTQNVNRTVRKKGSRDHGPT